MLTLETDPLTLAEDIRKLQKLREELRLQPDATRQQAANVVFRLGWAYYIGGHHVAVHHRKQDGRPHGPRVAFIMGTAPDWL